MVNGRRDEKQERTTKGRTSRILIFMAFVIAVFVTAADAAADAVTVTAD